MDFSFEWKKRIEGAFDDTASVVYVWFPDQT